MRLQFICTVTCLLAATTFAVDPWMDAFKTPDERVALLLPLLSLDEKVNQLLHGKHADHLFPLPVIRCPPLRRGESELFASH